jgi:hypothetical protein
MRFPAAGAFRLPALFVQQHSGDWTMTGKVPVARVEGQELLPATIGRMKPSGTSRPWQDRRTLIS